MCCVCPLVRQQAHKAERNAETQSYLVEVVSGIQTVKAKTLNYNLAVARALYYVSAGFNSVLTSTTAGSMSSFLNKLSGFAAVGWCLSSATGSIKLRAADCL